MPFGEDGQIVADLSKRWLRPHPARRRREYAACVQQLATQVQSAASRIFGEIAKYAGELQRAAEFCRDTLARRRLLAEDAHRKPADRDRYAFTIAIKLRARMSVRVSISMPSMMARSS